MRKTLATICLSLTIFGGCSSPAERRNMEEKLLVGKPAGVALDYYSVGFSDLHMVHEDRVLRAVFFDVKNGDGERFLWLKADTPLYSENRSWDYQAIRKAKVFKITHELLPAADSPFRERGKEDE